MLSADSLSASRSPEVSAGPLPVCLRSLSFSSWRPLAAAEAPPAAARLDGTEMPATVLRGRSRFGFLAGLALPAAALAEAGLRCADFRAAFFAADRFAADFFAAFFFPALRAGALFLLACFFAFFAGFFRAMTASFRDAPEGRPEMLCRALTV